LSLAFDFFLDGVEEITPTMERLIADRVEVALGSRFAEEVEVALGNRVAEEFRKYRKETQNSESLLFSGNFSSFFFFRSPFSNRIFFT
jgi:hypothetical protein